MNPTPHAPKPWYREPWPWLLAAGPIIVVFAAIYTYYLAATRNNPSMVTDDYYRQGKNIAMYMERDQHAHQRGIHGEVLINPETTQAKILLQGQIGQDEKLTLLFFHPARKENDRTVSLNRSPNAVSGNQVEYRAQFDALPAAHHWYVRVEDQAGIWRVQGKWETNQGNRIILLPLHQTQAGGTSSP